MNGMPRYVLLRHECPPGFGKPTHWDFMLERDDALQTWSLAELPAIFGGQTSCEHEVAAWRLPDHRLEYLEYEGSLSGNRGIVARIDAGDYAVIDESEDQLCVALVGVVRATVSLRRIEGDDWRFDAAERRLR
jgi:hypothetical protein